MIQDSYFGKGSTHVVCQDYATHRPGLAVLSDGCSTAQDTDIGARLLSLAALRVMGPGGITERYNELDDTELFAELIAYTAHLQAEACGVKISALTATLGVLRLRADGACNASLWGDGVVVVRQANGDIVVSHAEYSEGAPCYLNYRRLAGMEAFMQQFPKQKLVLERFRKTGDSPWRSSACETVNSKITTSIPRTLEPGDTMLIMSDGVNQFHNTKTNTPVPWQTIVESICDFKRFVGDFVNARMRFFDKECRRDGIVGRDDLSVIAIHRLVSDATN